MDNSNLEVREREGNGKNPFLKFGSGKEKKKNNSQNPGTEREWKKTIPKIREQEGIEKIHYHISGTGIRGYHSREKPETRKGMERKNQLIW